MTFINKQACRLKDIQDLFMDSGLGKESFQLFRKGKLKRFLIVNLKTVVGSLKKRGRFKIQTTKEKG